VHGVEVGDQGECRGHQPAAADALEEASTDHRGHVVGGGGEDRAEREDDQGGRQHRHPAAQVGDAPDERQHRDVPQQEARDDGRRPLQLLGGEPDALHHVDEGQDDDVGVGGRERDRTRRQPQQQPGPGRRARAGIAHRVTLTRER
jgi:hypothetical protein